jgi:CheY-like chemotaxis protein
MAKTLLLADDSVTIQKVVGISLASEDIRLVTVDNGDDALARARELRPDAILADCVMPGRNGYEVCEAIAADPALRHIPVLLLTGTFEAFDEERAVRCGAAGHIAKPFEAQTLLDEVQRLFALAASRRPAPTAPLQGAQGAAQRAAGERSAGVRPAATQPPVRLVTPPASGRAAAPAARPAASAGESFDFFDEEIDDLLPAEIAEEPGFEAGHEVDLDSSETPFAFGEAESRPAAARPLASPAAEHTVAIPRGAAQRGEAERSVGPRQAGAPGAAQRGAGERRWSGAELPEARTAPAPPAAGDLEDVEATIGEADLTRLDADASQPSRRPPPERTLVAHGLEDLDLEAPSGDAGSLLRVDERDLAGATILDPQSAGSYDVSASDLGDPFALDAPIAAPRADTAEAGASLRAAPAARAARDAAALELLEPEPEPPPQPDFPEDRGLVVSAAEPAAAADVEVSALAQSALDALGPRMRAQLHDTLEKVAWESLSDVTDQVVRQAVERIEAIAWEVIPQMAETLIREEIRRMKGEDGS